MFRSQLGLFGLGPALCRVGDELWVAMGGKGLMVLRPVDEGSFQILGDAYVLEFMQGEATPGLMEEDFTEIQLC